MLILPLYTTGSVCKHTACTWEPQAPTHHPRRLHRTQTPRHLPHIIRPRTRKKKPQPHLQRHTQLPEKKPKKKGEKHQLPPIPWPWPNGAADAYAPPAPGAAAHQPSNRKSTRLNSSHVK